jgi:LAO/AO transport system kinase
MESDTGTVERLAAGILERDRGALARAVTLVEREAPEGAGILAALSDRTGRARRIGITGPPGCGKSTLVGAMLRRWLGRGLEVGVVAVDPSSPFTGGAVLGDRIRMADAARHELAFVRSMATRGALGGLARAARGTADLMDAFGFHTVLLETVGVGQSEIEVASVADTVVVVLAPGAGDGLQAMKAGIMEIGQVFVVNKADLEGAAATRAIVEAELRSRPAGPVPVLTACALTGEGVDELIEALDGQR